MYICILYLCVCVCPCYFGRLCIVLLLVLFYSMVIRILKTYHKKKREIGTACLNGAGVEEVYWYIHLQNDALKRTM